MSLEGKGVVLQSYRRESRAFIYLLARLKYERVNDLTSVYRASNKEV